MNEPTTVPGKVGLGTLPQRFLIAYTFFYMLPFPLGMLEVLNAIPWFESSVFAKALQSVLGWHAQVTGPVVQVLGQYLTGREVSLELTGSGDSLASYLDILVDAGLALFLAVIWWGRQRSKPLSPIVAEVHRVLLRYYLFTIMVVYGLVKFIPGGQFLPLGPDRLLQPYGESSPMGLLWTFMGASVGYQMFCGASEILGGILLLFRRTTLLGSVLVVAVMANVFALNLFFDVPVKLFSFHLVFFGLILAAPEAGRLFALFFANTTVPARDQQAPWAPSPRLYRAVMALKLVFILLFFKLYIGRGMDWFYARQEALHHPLRGIYEVEFFSAGDTRSQVTKNPEDEADRWLRVGLTPPSSITIQRSDGSATRMKLRLDMEASELSIYRSETPEPAENPMLFKWLQKDLLHIRGDFEGRQISVKLRRDDKESLLTGRGFHWISETPFNR